MINISTTCVICGRNLSGREFERQEVVACIMPLSAKVIAACDTHFFRDGKQVLDYGINLRKFSAAIAMNLPAQEEGTPPFSLIGVNFDRTGSLRTRPDDTQRG